MGKIRGAKNKRLLQLEADLKEARALLRQQAERAHDAIRTRDSEIKVLRADLRDALKNVVKIETHLDNERDCYTFVCQVDARQINMARVDGYLDRFAEDAAHQLKTQIVRAHFAEGPPLRSRQYQVPPIDDFGERHHP